MFTIGHHLQLKCSLLIVTYITYQVGSGEHSDWSWSLKIDTVISYIRLVTVNKCGTHTKPGTSSNLVPVNELCMTHA
uniref:Secreted protein n=1 Tax=Kalanchoe fedtschenkoi TaxID=63787 RepID=A0A7N1A7C2_KALFE